MRMPPGVGAPRTVHVMPALTPWLAASLVVEGIRDPIIYGLSWSALGKGLAGIGIFMGIGAVLSAFGPAVTFVR